MHGQEHADRPAMDPTDKQWDSNDDMKAWKTFIGKYMPGANTADGNYVYAYAVPMPCRT